MKKVIAFNVACILMTGLVLASQPGEADQKWLTVVQKKVAAGETRISTPLESRVTLLKEWADKNGYTVAVTVNQSNHRIEVTKNIAQK